MTTAPTTPSFKLNNGLSIPAIGIGCWMGVPGEGKHVTDMVLNALNVGYRHIDTAANYGNEESVGKALALTHVPRSEIFLTTKLDQKDHGNVQAALDTSLRKLGVDYVDLYLMHWPMAVDPLTGRTLQPDESPTIHDTWAEMEKLVGQGKARSIGVSNFSIKLLTRLLSHSPNRKQITIQPAINQIETHPFLPNTSLLRFCADHGIQVVAYSPLGKHREEVVEDEVVRGVVVARARVRAHDDGDGEQHGSGEQGEQGGGGAGSGGVTPAQVLISWAVERGCCVVTKSVREERMRVNLSLIPLTNSEIHALNNIHKQPGKHRSVCGFHSPDLGGSCFGWTYEQLGWDGMRVGGVVSEANDFDGGKRVGE